MATATQCTNYLPGSDASGSICQHCGVAPEHHADSPGCNEWRPTSGGVCLCGRAGCQHPREVVAVKAILRAGKAVS